MVHSEFHVNKVLGFLDKTIEDFPHEGYCDICIDWRIFTPVFPHLIEIFDGYEITYMGHTNEWVMFRFEDESEYKQTCKDYLNSIYGVMHNEEK